MKNTHAKETIISDLCKIFVPYLTQIGKKWHLSLQSVVELCF